MARALVLRGGWVWAPDQVWGDGSWGRGWRGEPPGVWCCSRRDTPVRARGRLRGKRGYDGKGGAGMAGEKSGGCGGMRRGVREEASRGWCRWRRDTRGKRGYDGGGARERRDVLRMGVGGRLGRLCCEGGWVWAPDQVWGDGSWVWGWRPAARRVGMSCGWALVGGSGACVAKGVGFGPQIKSGATDPGRLDAALGAVRGEIPAASAGMTVMGARVWWRGAVEEWGAE